MTSFIFRPYTVLPEGFEPVMFYTDVVIGGDISMTQIPLFENLYLPSFTEKSLALLVLLIPFLRENSEEMNAVYAHF